LWFLKLRARSWEVKY
jgi:hypothetical protein